MPQPKPLVRGVREDPFRNFKYKVKIPGITTRTGFSRVSGLKENTEPVDYREGTDPARPRKLIGQTSYDNVILETGLTKDFGLVRWRRLITDVTAGKGRNATREGQARSASDIRKTVSVTLVEYHGTPTWRWDVVDAWPISLEISEFSGDGNDVVLETLELVHEGIRTYPPT